MIGRRGLRRVGDQEDLLLGERVHLCASCKVVWRLGAAVQHHDERDELTPISAWDVELVVPAAGRISVSQRLEARTVWQRGWRMGRHGADQPVKAGWQARGGADLSEAVQEIAQC